MIVEFSVKNFRSIAELQTISFVASNLKSSKDHEIVDCNNICDVSGMKLLRTIGVYGANASGKSNIIQALDLFCVAVADLPSPESRLSKLAQPFLYQDHPENTESFFQIVLLVEGKKYRYGFTVKKNIDTNSKSSLSREKVVSEWLFGQKNANQGKFFTRTDLELDTANLPGNEQIPDLEYEHTLFLTHAASFSKDICAKIRKVISGNIASKFSLQNDYYRFHSIRFLDNVERKTDFLEFLRSFGFNYTDISYVSDHEDNGINRYPLAKLFLTKYASNNGDRKVILNMQEHESDGTKKLFDLAGLLFLAFNLEESVLIILDELDSNFHPSLLIKLLSLFNNPIINKANAQLLFTSHDTNLMDPSLMRRDQFYFTEKEHNEGTRLYSLAELKGIRNDADFAKQYLAGFYGGLPVLMDYVSSENVDKHGAMEH